MQQPTARHSKPAPIAVLSTTIKAKTAAIDIAAVKVARPMASKVCRTKMVSGIGLWVFIWFPLQFDGFRLFYHKLGALLKARYDNVTYDIEQGLRPDFSLYVL